MTNLLSELICAGNIHVVRVCGPEKAIFGFYVRCPRSGMVANTQRSQPPRASNFSEFCHACPSCVFMVVMDSTNDHPLVPTKKERSGNFTLNIMYIFFLWCQHRGACIEIPDKGTRCRNNNFYAIYLDFVVEYLRCRKLIIIFNTILM